MEWLAPPDGFRARLTAAKALADPDARLGALVELANTRLSYLETMQLDAALQRTGRTESFDSIKLAMLAGATIDHLAPAVRVAGLRRALRIETYAGGYGQYRQELLDPASPLHAFKPNAVLLSLVAHDFIGAVPLASSDEEAEAAVQAAAGQLRGLWRHAQAAFGAIVIQQSFLDVSEPILGGLDAMTPGAPAHLVARLNAALAEAAHSEGVLWLDIARASARDGRDAWFDVAKWLHGKFEIAPQAAPLFGDLVARLIGAARGRSKKCLVLDLDNTLWGGVIGDDGIDGIVLGQGSGTGEAFLALHRYAKALKERGVLLAVCSKNDPQIARAALQDHPESILRPADFASFVANWTDKAENLRTIARELNIGIDSLVFVDDNPAERARVREALPMVATPELPTDSAHYVRCIAAAGYFESVSFTQEDRERGGQYETRLAREKLRDESDGMEGFLKGLEMAVEHGPIGPAAIGRATQLLNKTNQFNTTTIRRTEAETAALVETPGAIGLQFRLIDKFGDNGIVSVMIATPGPDEGGVELVNWVMSCRVFGRQLEDEAMNIFAEEAVRRGVRRINAAFVPTAKNGVIKNLFANLGFSPDARCGADTAASAWTLSLETYVPRPTFIRRREFVHD